LTGEKFGMLTMEAIAGALARGPAIVGGLIAAAPSEALTWREAPGSWTCVEVVAHMAEAEITNWMPRVRCIVEDRAAFDPFDRDGGFARFEGWSADALVREFARLRTANVEALSSLRLTDADLHRAGAHPELGRVTLGQLLSTWATHDMAHVSQMSRVLTRALGQHAGPWRKYFSLLAASDPSSGHR
jgi:hypothetical protein